MEKRQRFLEAERARLLRDPSVGGSTLQEERRRQDERQRQQRLQVLERMAEGQDSLLARATLADCCGVRVTATGRDFSATASSARPAVVVTSKDNPNIASRSDRPALGCPE